MKILPEWEKIDLSQLKGTLLVVGATDVGKSTFARYLYGRLHAASRRVAYLDGDPGQGRLGPPTTMTLATGDIDTVPPQDRVWRRFVGSPSPVGHMLPVVVGAGRLVQSAFEAGTEVIIYDTTGLIDPDRGGINLKLAKINLIRPTILFAIQRFGELEPLLAPLRRSRRVRLVEMRPPPDAQQRDLTVRRAYRAAKFARYFAMARPLKLKWTRVAVHPEPAFTLNRLVALEDVEGFTLGLGIATEIMPESGEVTLLTPLPSLNGLDSIQLGDVAVDLDSFVEVRINTR